jgi:predicted nuclease of predicted toxin-antitoxin system
VKLLFDENVSPELPRMLASEYPGSAHVRAVGLRGAEDWQIWDYCLGQGFAIVSKDTDFRERSFVEGFPPKVIWLDIGNAGTTMIADLLWRERQRVEAFGNQDETSCLILSIGPGAV